MELKDIIKGSKELLENSYAPYSNFPVGTILEMKDGALISGVNVENASFGATICAERNAITSAVAKGYQKGDFKRIVIISNSKTYTIPCALCLQLMAEFFSNDTEIVLVDKNEKYIIKTLNDLLPYGFTGSELRNV